MMIDFNGPFDRPEFDYDDGTFRCRDDGVWYHKKGKTTGKPKAYQEIWICDPIDVIAFFYEAERYSWCRLFVWRDPSNRPHRARETMSSFHNDFQRVRGYLASEGLSMSMSHRARALMAAYLACHPVKQHAHQDEEGNWYWGESNPSTPTPLERMRSHRVNARPSDAPADERK